MRHRVLSASILCLLPFLATAPTALAEAKPKPAFQSKTVSAATPGHRIDVKADIKGAKDLYLVVTDAGDGFGCDWADWAEPRLVSASGKETKLTELKWRNASSDWGSVRLNQNAGGGALKINDQPVAYGIGTHANSVVHFPLPKSHDFVTFLASAGVDNGGTSQGCGSTVQFMVYTEAPPRSLTTARATGGGGNASREPQDALAGLDVHEDLQAELFAAEPMLTNPSNTDIDHLGRVWVAEIVNYRRHKGKQPEGDRILILEDTDGDGKADKRTVFYQEKDFFSPHGITVLATPDFKNTRVIVAVGDKVLNLIDVNGDGKADRKEVMFTGISGTQHDHGIHQFIFGPDGKLYFNFGNSGNQIRDASGKQIVDKMGNEVKANRQPYQQGMVFRCNLDGSDFETLGWNFRNNWMATVDSFGNIWQSDNDDDGNRGVRINFVMEYGNYGYRDELTGAGWQAKRVGMAEDVPSRHWYQNDPGVVPNLLQTGAGSPTGITVYEGDLLPKVFRGQMIHTDAGPNVCRAYPVKKDGAGYSASIEDILVGTRDKWYRPSDVKVAPDGSLIIADWYDPGVGGHNAGDLERGRLFRITPKGHKGYKVPEQDFSSPEGAALALMSPTYATRYVAWQALSKMGKDAEPILGRIWREGKHPHHRARALWWLSKLENHGHHYVAEALKDKDADIRVTAIRAARQIEMNMPAIVRATTGDVSPQVRREACIALAELKGDEVPALWAGLAMKHDGKDRWYLEALGIAARGRWDACFDAWLKEVNGKWDTPGGRDIVWRARTKAALPLLVKILKDSNTPDDRKPRYTRAFDFHPKSAEKDAALLELLQ